MVVVPSLTFRVEELSKIVGVPFYEERLLCLLLFLRRPGLHMVFVTSQPVDPAVVDYYLGFLPDPDDARRRLDMVAVGDTSIDPLSQKLLDRPELLDRLGKLVAGRPGSYLLAFSATPMEHALATGLGLPVDGAPPGAGWTGSKSGARKVANQAGVAVPYGREDLFSVEDVASALLDIRKARPDAEQAVVKLNNGFSGQGNAIVRLDGIDGGWLDSWPTTFCASEESWPSFAAKVEAEGAIAEELIRVPGLVSPSVQIRVAPDGRVEVMSSHDQLLGGLESQVYLGCRYPASEVYREAIVAQGLKLAAVLAAEGMLGWFGIDFLVADGQVLMSEINLRLGGTTHPYWMARLALDRPPVAYVATDNLKSPALVGRTPTEVIEKVRKAGLAFDAATGTGVTLHLLGALPEHGKMGSTSIGSSLEEADELHRRLLDLLL